MISQTLLFVEEGFSIHFSIQWLRCDFTTILMTYIEGEARAKFRDLGLYSKRILSYY